MEKLKELSFEELKSLNEGFDAEHKFSEIEVELSNTLRLNFPNRVGKHKTPQVLDILDFVDETGEHYPQAMIRGFSSDNKSVSIYQHAHVPFVSLHDQNGIGEKSISFSMGGGSEVYLPINNLVCVGTKEVLMNQFSRRCHTPAFSSVSVPVRVNLWNLKEPINKYGKYSTKNYLKYFISFHREYEDGYASDFLRGLYFSTKKEYSQWLSDNLAIEFTENENVVVFSYKVNSHYYKKDCPFSRTVHDFDKIEENLKEKGYDYEIVITSDNEYITKKVVDHTNHIILEHKLKKDKN